MKKIIAQEEHICNFLHSKNINFLSTISQKHIKEIIIAATAKGFSGKTTDIEEYSQNHRTTLSYFLSKGKWDEKLLEKVIQKESMKFISEKSTTKNRTLYVSIDDMVSHKKKPSSQDLRPIQSADFHFSHLQKKQVWGHQIQATMVGNVNTKFFYHIQRYTKALNSKIQNAVDVANSLPIATSESYALFDSWYTCPKIIDAFEKKGYYSIGALKTNRVIYPQGIQL